jgi:excisionase family DNA binding protein
MVFCVQVQNNARMVTQNKALAVSVPEAARMLGVSTRTLQYLIAARQIRITKIGRRTIISVTVLEDFLRSDLAKMRTKRRHG